MSSRYRPPADGLYLRCAAAVPRWLSPATREDAISDLYLAVLETRVPFADIEKAGRAFGNRAARLYENRYGPLSLDAARFDDGGESIVATIPDPSALAAFDHLFEGAIL